MTKSRTPRPGDRVSLLETMSKSLSKKLKNSIDVLLLPCLKTSTLERFW